MTKTNAKNSNRIRRHARLRAKVSGTASRPRVAVFKSNQYTYVQVVDDAAHKTLIGLNDEKMKGGGAPKEAGAKEKKAFALGETVAEKLKGMKIAEAVFDRGGFKYHGRIKAIAEGLRAGGIKI
jgi:large subunit ribosomal protein L18